MSFHGELKNMGPNELVESLESLFARLAASGEDPDELGARVSREIPAFEAFNQHIREDMVRMGWSGEDADKVAYGATLALLAVAEKTKTSELGEAFGAPTAKERPSAPETE